MIVWLAFILANTWEGKLEINNWRRILENYLLEASILFGNPQLWTDPMRHNTIRGMEKENTFHVSQTEGLDDVVPGTLIREIRNVGVVGINPKGIALAFQLQHLGHSVTLLPSGFESSTVGARLENLEVFAFFERYGIAFRPYVVKALRGEQIHCQSGYCSFVCEGRFIEEGNIVERIVTDAGNFFVDLVILAVSTGQ